MPRLTTKQYIRTHDQLRRLWLNQDPLYAELSPREQWQLHDFFQPAKDLTDPELLEHRATITIARPSLPHQAGQAHSKFLERAASLAVRRVHASKALAQPRTGSKRQRVQQLSVTAVVKPEIDLKKLSQALLFMARQPPAAIPDHRGGASPDQSEAA